MRSNQLQLADPSNSGYRLPTEAEWAWVARFNGGETEN
jgi:formylglycine-generating enzyme required for sulfatase activity